MTSGTPSPTQIDLTNCDHEPIHIPGNIQPHGVLLGLDQKACVVRASENCESVFGRPIVAVLGRSLKELVAADVFQELIKKLNGAPHRSHASFLRSVTLTHNDVAKQFDAIGHRTDNLNILELETTDNDPVAIEPSAVYQYLDEYTLDAESLNDIPELCSSIASTIRDLTGFDRVLVYRFDADWNGSVVGEHGNGKLPLLLHHRFPASDIPAQARDLYRLNRVRIIPDASYQPVPLLAINPDSKAPLDMTFCTLRSVSPVHVEYMRNMETASSMSISILRNGRLWGLISCHHRQPRFVTFHIRTTCDLLVRAFALRLSALEHTDHYERRVGVRTTYSKLLSTMSDRGDYAEGLLQEPSDLLSFVNASGAAVVTPERCQLVGRTPTEEQVTGLANWLFKTVSDDVYATDSLIQTYEPSREFADQASGLLAVSISKLHPNYVMWFRPELVQTIQWGGDPRKAVESNGDGPTRLHPRKSFETWKEIVRDKSAAWDPSEIDGAIELRNAIVGIVLRKAEELVELNSELKRSNNELEAFSYSVSHDLRAPLRHIVGYAEMLKEEGGDTISARGQRCIDVIIESSEYAGLLVDKLLGYSRLGRSELQMAAIDMNMLVREIQRAVMLDAADRKVEWRIVPLPEVHGDLMMIRMAFGDLLSNAVKYTRDRSPAVIEVDCREETTEFVFRVKDNGVGFEMQYVDKLFGVFQRLHRWEDYEGTGIGLANVRRVIERHGGRTWAVGQPGLGATFYVTLPKVPTA